MHTFRLPDKEGRERAGAEHGSSFNKYGGLYCPCHGSKFDIQGRVFKGVSAPTNMVIPPYRYIDDNTIQIGIGSQDKSTPGCPILDIEDFDKIKNCKKNCKQASDCKHQKQISY